MGLLEALSYGLPCLVTTGTNMAEKSRADAGWTSDISVDGISEALKSIKKKGNHSEREKSLEPVK